MVGEIRILHMLTEHQNTHFHHGDAEVAEILVGISQRPLRLGDEFWHALGIGLNIENMNEIMTADEPRA